MIIAFDLDGVLREGHLGLFKLCTTDPTPQKIEALEIETMASCKPLLNPMLFATKDDVIYCISNCGSEWSLKQKREWLYHFYGKRITFEPVQVAKGLWKKAYCDATAKAKIDLMIKLGVEVYFDDDPAIINAMRNLVKTEEYKDLAGHIKFIKYGTWVEEYY